MVYFPILQFVKNDSFVFSDFIFDFRSTFICCCFAKLITWGYWFRYNFAYSTKVINHFYFARVRLHSPESMYVNFIALFSCVVILFFVYYTIVSLLLCIYACFVLTFTCRSSYICGCVRAIAQHLPLAEVKIWGQIFSAWAYIYVCVIMCGVTLSFCDVIFLHSVLCVFYFA